MAAWRVSSDGSVTDWVTGRTCAQRSLEVRLLEAERAEIEHIETAAEVGVQRLERPVDHRLFVDVQARIEQNRNAGPIAEPLDQPVK